MSTFSFKAVIFDMDGVITRTAEVHNLAWKKMFDEYLEYRSKTTGEPFQEFDSADDYLTHIDGKPRYKGVRDFLESRNISLPYGTPGDEPGYSTICALGNIKDRAFNEILVSEGVSVYESTVKLVRVLKENSVKIAVASSSKNCRPVLAAAGLADVFHAVVDGIVLEQESLEGKPAPDIFIRACKMVGVAPAEAVVVEDAVSGVQAGRNGGFGLVIGLARENNREQLSVNGADIVAGDLEEIELVYINEIFPVR